MIMLLEVQSLEVISLNIWEILFSLLNLLVIFLIIKKILFAPVKKVFAARRAVVDKIYDDAAAAKEVAEKDKALYEEKLAGAKEEAGEIVSSARERAERLGSEIVSEANIKAEQRYKKAEEEIAQEKKKAMSELKDDISGISVDIAEKIVGREISASDHEKFIDDFINNVGDEDE